MYRSPQPARLLATELARGSDATYEDGEGLGNTNGVRELNQAAASKTSVHKRLGDPTGAVGSGTIDLGEILSGESSTTVGTPTTVGVDDDLTASETGITLGTANDEETGGLDLKRSALDRECAVRENIRGTWCWHQCTWGRCS
jgi:hypothetical protein